MDNDPYWQMVHRPVKLVFRTVHFDKAGETSDHCVIEADIADVDSAGTVLLATSAGIPVSLPIDKLYPADADAPSPQWAEAFLAGQELTRDFHPQVGAPRTVLRWLDRAEIERLLAEE